MYRWRGKALPTVPAAEAPRRRADPDLERRRAMKRIDSQARRQAFNAWRQAYPDMYEREWRAALIVVHARGADLSPSARHSAARSHVISVLGREHPDLWKPLYASVRAEVAQDPAYRL